VTGPEHGIFTEHGEPTSVFTVERGDRIEIRGVKEIGVTQNVVVRVVDIDDGPDGSYALLVEEVSR
jgi:hypothetical protein